MKPVMKWLVLVDRSKIEDPREYYFVNTFSITQTFVSPYSQEKKQKGMEKSPLFRKPSEE